MRTGSLLEVATVSRTGRVVTAERTAASAFMPPLHAHAADEAIHVVEGRLTVFAGADVVTVAAVADDDRVAVEAAAELAVYPRRPDRRRAGVEVVHLASTARVLLFA